MKLLKIIYGITMCCLCVTAHGYNMRVDDKSFVLNQNKYTSPAFATSINGVTFYGALYDGMAPDKTLHIQYGDNNYWLGQNCDAGTYSETGVSACTDCGIGYYCTGAMTRTPCTYGAISCNDVNYSTDAPIPADAPINKFMTLDEVNEFMPITDLSDWRQISCCNNQHIEATKNNLSTLNNPANACATGTIGPGTYLFIARYYSPILIGGSIDCIDGTKDQITNAFIAVFDHPVSYASMHGTAIFQHFVDTEHVTYTEWTLSTVPIGWWSKNENITNISNLTDLPPNTLYLCVFELK